jgi:hypothetical protein
VLASTSYFENEVCMCCTKKCNAKTKTCGSKLSYLKNDVSVIFEMACYFHKQSKPACYFNFFKQRN